MQHFKSFVSWPNCSTCHEGLFFLLLLSSSKHSHTHIYTHSKAFLLLSRKVFQLFKQRAKNMHIYLIAGNCLISYAIWHTVLTGKRYLAVSSTCWMLNGGVVRSVPFTLYVPLSPSLLHTLWLCAAPKMVVDKKNRLNVVVTIIVVSTPPHTYVHTRLTRSDSHTHTCALYLF